MSNRYWNPTYACLALSLALIGCAGPTSPFGAIRLFPGATGDSVALKSDQDGPIRIHFSPRRQVLHGASSLTVTIEDDAGVPEDASIHVTHNGIDITPAFLARAVRVYEDEGSRRRVKYSVKTLRLVAARENKLVFTYRRGPDAIQVSQEYGAPRCSAFSGGRAIASVPRFSAPIDMIEFVNHYANRARVNPYYVAGLIAQESAFNPLALSRARALGLTQITSQAEAEIIGSYDEWPRYPGLDEMPLAQLKYSIWKGTVHAGNEWRLDPALSIQGGVDYINYLAAYWSRNDKKALLQRRLGQDEHVLSEVILASYNSGAARVSQAIERQGVFWLQDDELGEARKYVRRVVSYCDHFQLAGE